MDIINFVSAIKPENGDLISALFAIFSFFIHGIFILVANYRSNNRRLKVESDENYFLLKGKYEKNYDLLILKSKNNRILKINYDELSNVFTDKNERNEIKTLIHRLFDIFADSHFTSINLKEFENRWGGELHYLFSNDLFKSAWSRQRNHFLNKSLAKNGGIRYSSFIEYVDDFSKNLELSKNQSLNKIELINKISIY